MNKEFIIMASTKSMHIPLPVQWYEKLSQISKEKNTTATELVRNAIIEFLKEEERKKINDAILDFASEYGGSEFDLDTDLEESSLESLRKV